VTWATIEAALIAWVRAATGLGADAVRLAGQNFPQVRPMVIVNIAAVVQRGYDWADTEDNFITIADDTAESVDATANTLTLTAHGLLTGDGPVRWTTTDTLPGGMAIDTNYWIVRVDANTIKLAATFADAMAASPVTIDLTDTGTGSHTLVDTATTTHAGAEIISRARGTRTATVSIQAFPAAGVVGGATSARALLELVRAHAALPTRREALRVAGIGLAPLGAVSSIDGVIGSALFEPRATLEATLHLASEVTETGTYIESALLQRVDEDGDPAGDEFEVP
jgi:hypothetical protein